MRVAIVIPVRGDARGLAVTLQSISRMETADHTVDVIVAVDGGEPSCVDVARSHGATVVELAPPRGSYAARNAAIARIDPAVDVVLFTDAGCVPRPKWMLAHIDALASAPLVGGAILRTTSHRPTPAEYVDSVRNLTQLAYVENDGFAATANLAVRREVLDAIQFDASLQSGGDREFCHRAAARGFAIAFGADAEVEHDCRRTVRELESKARRVGTGVAALPDESRPVRLPTPRLGVPLARRAWREGISRNPVWLARVAVADRRRTQAFVDAARAAGFRAPVRELDVVVFLGTRMSALETVGTRWHHLLRELVRRPDVARVTVVDFPRTRRSLGVARLRALAHRRHGSWLAGVDVVDAVVPVGDGTSPLSPLMFRRTAAAIDHVLGTSRGTRVAIAASPLWAPVVAHVGADVRVFDAVDDQRSLPSLRSRARWVEAGYRAAGAFDAVTSNVGELAAELGGVHVANGVDVTRFASAGPKRPDGIGAGPFAAYVGVIQERFDVDLVRDLAVALDHGSSIVVVGPADEPTARTLASIDGVHYLGPLPGEEVAPLLRAATVGIVPHRVDDQTRRMDPLKVLEYRAAGLPVVSTPVRLPVPAAAPVYVESTPSAFIARVKALLAAPPASVPLADDRPWSVVADELISTAIGGSR